MVAERANNMEITKVSVKVIGEVHLRKYGKFLDKWIENLQKHESYFRPNKLSNMYVSDIIQIDWNDYETLTALDMSTTDNKILNKIVATFAGLCTEAMQRKEEAQKHFDNLRLLAEKFSQPTVNTTRGDLLIVLGRSLMVLQELLTYVDRVHNILMEFVYQLAAIYATNAAAPSEPVLNPINIHFEDMMLKMADLLVVLHTIDQLLSKVNHLDETWSLYRRIIRTVHVEINADRLKSFEHMLKALENGLIKGGAFQKAIDKLVAPRDLTKLGKLAEEMMLFVNNMLPSLTNEDRDDLWPKVICLFVFAAELFGIQDRRILRQVCEFCKKYPFVDLPAGAGISCPAEFLRTHISYALKSDEQKILQQTLNCRLELLQQKCSILQLNNQRLLTNVTCWTIQMGQAFAASDANLTIAELKKRCSLLLEGSKLARGIKTKLTTILNLHIGLAKPITKSTLVSLCTMTELLKAIEETYCRHCFRIAEQIDHILHYLKHEIIKVLDEARRRILQSQKTITHTNLDTLSGVVLAQQVIQGPGSRLRCLVSRLAVSIARGGVTKMLKDEEIEIIYRLLQDYDKLLNVQRNVADSCDTSHLYFQSIFLPVKMGSFANDLTAIATLPYLVRGLSDIVDNLPRDDQRKSVIDKWRCVTEKQLQSGIIHLLCDRVETDLRMQIHRHLQIDAGNLLKNDPVGGGSLITALASDPVKFFENLLNFRPYIEHYLNTTFYNLTAVALHDGRSYDAMRALVDLKFDLKLIAPHLPSQALEQTVDVLEIMRNIHVFVANYNYNMNNQIFIEMTSPNKHLNTISIQQVSNSIRSHGTGIINTTVNFTYQFLRKKLYVFSQFLFDEQIKSRLAKDVAFMRERKDYCCYPYERADKFNKGIRKLGVTADGHSFLDQFRRLITQLGNAMGYVRMVRSGGLHMSSNAFSFLKNDKTPVIGNLCKDSHLSRETIEAAECVKNVIINLAQNFSEGTQYFRLLVEVFASDFRDPKNTHLANFYIIIPPLTINFVEHMVASKEKLARKSKNALFTDDGFVMGLAYLLTVLDQHETFLGLHWFDESVEKKLAQERGAIQETKGEDTLCKANLLTAKRLDACYREFQWLAFSLNSAKVFFQKQVAKDCLNVIKE